MNRWILAAILIGPLPPSALAAEDAPESLVISVRRW